MSIDLENRPRLASVFDSQTGLPILSAGVFPAMDGTELYADITASTAALQQTLTAVTQTWITSMLDSFNQTNAMVWSLFSWPGAQIAQGRHDDNDPDR